VRGIRIRFSIPCSLNLFKKRKIEEENCLTPPLLSSPRARA